MSTAKIFNKLFLESVEIPVIVIRDIDREYNIGDIRIGPHSKGEKIKIPYRILDILVKENLVDIDMSNIPGLSDMRKIAWIESRSNDLQAIDKNFYINASLWIKKLKSKLIENYDTKTLKEIEETTSILYDLIKCRLNKILTLVISSHTPSRDIMEKMTEEEKILYIWLCTHVREWFDSMKKIIEGEI